MTQTQSPSLAESPALPAVAAPERAGYARYVLVILTLLYAVNWMDRYIFIILMEPVKRDLQISDTALGFLSGFAFSAIYAFAGLPLARWADRRNRVSLIVAGLAFWSAMTAACGLVRNFWQLAAGRIGVGLGEAACSPPAHSLISDYFPPHRRGAAFAVYGLGLYIGMTAGLVVGGWLNEAYGWRAAFIIVGLPGLLLALTLKLTVKEPTRGASEQVVRPTETVSAWRTARFMLGLPSFVAYAAGLGLFSLSANAVNVWAAVFMMRVHHMPSHEVGQWTGYLGGLAGMLGTLLFGFLADHLSRRDLRWYLWTPSLAIALMAPAILLFLYGEGTGAMVGYFLATMFAASCLAPTLAVTQRLMPVRMRAVSSAVLAIGLNLVGSGVGNLVTGALNDALSATYGETAIRYSLTCTTLVGGAVGVALTLVGAWKLRSDMERVAALA